MARDGALGTRTLSLAALGAAVVVTASVVGLDVRFGLAGEPGEVALDSVSATAGLAMAFLLYGRFRVSGLLRDLLLCLALTVLGGGNALLAVLPAVSGGTSHRLTFGGILAGVSAGLLFALAVWLPQATLPAARRRWSVLLLLVVPAVLLLGLAQLLSTEHLQEGLGATDAFGGTSDLLVRGAQALAALAFLAAAVGWCRPVARLDRMAAPLAVAAVLGGASRVDLALAGEPVSPWVTAGTVLRVLFYAALVAAVVLEVRDYWQLVADAAVLEERRRLARELHDGVAQELAFIATQARALREQSTNRRAQLVAGAAERALDESRRAIAALTRALDEPLEVALGQAVEEVAGRFGTTVRTQVASGLRVDGPRREALVRIAREAVANAGRHGHAQTVLVKLENGHGVTLRIADDGSGFSGDTMSGSGHFGLVSMRERAAALGGRCDVRSRPGEGTEVVAWLP